MKIFTFLIALFLGGVSCCEGADARLIILGFDGVDPTLLEKWVDEGKLPHLASLRRSGTYLHLGSTLPPQSPVSWASFATGMNPAKTRIFDFLQRVPGSYYPDFAMVGRGESSLFPNPIHRLLVSALLGLAVFTGTFLLFKRSRARNILSAGVGLLLFGMVSLFFSWIPKEVPKPISRREGGSFWQTTSRHGIPSVLIRIPASFPPEALQNGRLLSGLGVPDLRKSFGTFSFYTSETTAQALDTEMGGKIIPVTLRGKEIDTFIWGPKNFTRKGDPDILPRLHLTVEEAQKRCTLRLQGRSTILKEGEWSPWVLFRFDLNPLLHLSGMGRFYLMETSPAFKLYLSPLHFHPAKLPPNFSLSSPRNFSRKLSEAVGLFKTLGWAQETWALNEERLDEKAFLDDLFETEKKFEAMMFHELSKRDWRLFVGVFEGTDRAQHMFWRTLDPGHPAYDPEEAAAYGDVIFKTYEAMDRTVGEVTKRFVDDRTILFVLSDHGFRSFRRSVNLNTWLVQKGYMTLKGMETRDRNLEDLFGRGEFWPNVDWSKTKAYALGLAGLYINRSGREPEGIVSEEEYETVRDRLMKDLLALQDPKTGAFPLLKGYRREEVYSGPYLEETPDLLLGLQEGYRISWQTALGGIPQEVFEDNLKKWSGDHCSYDPSITAGIFLCNRKLPSQKIHIMDIAPTVLELFGLSVPAEMDGRSFWNASNGT